MLKQYRQHFQYLKLSFELIPLISLKFTQTYRAPVLKTRAMSITNLVLISFYEIASHVTGMFRPIPYILTVSENPVPANLTLLEFLCI